MQKGNRMREIKFRAWDEEAEYMFYSDKREDSYFFEFNVRGRLRGYAIRPPKVSSDPMEPPEPYTGNYPVMQSTGLKDKKGKENFHKDILDWNGNRFVIEWDNDNGLWYGSPLTGNKERGILAGRAFKEANNIGNATENPELLEPK